jgi:hypothetical protein
MIILKILSINKEGDLPRTILIGLIEFGHVFTEDLLAFLAS